MVGLGLIFYNGLIYIFVNNTQPALDQSETDIPDLFKELGYQGILISQILSHILVLIFPAFTFIWYYSGRQTFIQDIHFSSREGILALSILFASAPLVSLLTIVNLWIPLPESLSQAEENIAALLRIMANPQGIWDKVLLFTTLAIVPAISEEFMFRSAIFRLLRNWTTSNFVIILASAFIFSSFHFQFEGFLPRFFLGIVLGYAYVEGKALIYPILMHFTFNGAQLVLLIFNGQEILNPSNKISTLKMEDGVLAVVGLVCLIFLFNYWKKIKSHERID